MKKLLLFAASVLMSATLSAQDMTNIGADQLTSLSPAPGKFDLDYYEMGFSSMVFNFRGGAEVDRTRDIYITVTRDGNVIANVPASNTSQVKYDNFYADVWQVSFFNQKSAESFAGGHYQVTIPEGFFLVGADKTPNSLIVLNYVMELNGISIYPEESKPLAELKEFLVTFGKSARVEINPNAEHKIELIDHYGGENFTDDNQTGVDDDGNSFAIDVTAEGNSVKVVLVNPITKPSTYDLGIPAGALTLYDSEGIASACKDLTFQYHIPKVGLGQPAIEPEAGEVYEFPGVIEIILQEGETRSTVNTMGGNYLYAVNEDGSLGVKIADYRATYEFYKDEKGNEIPENANKVFLKNTLGADARICPAPGLYRLVTANGLYMVKLATGNMWVNSFEYDFEVIEGVLYDMVLEPATNAVVNSLNEIKVGFPYAENIKVVWGTAWLRSQTTAYQFYPQGNVEDNTVVFKTSVPATMPGKYRFTSDVQSLNVDGDMVCVCADYTIEPNTSAKPELTNIAVLPAYFDIYNTQGMIIRRNATVEELNALPAGIYIAAGQKIVNRW